MLILDTSGSIDDAEWEQLLNFTYAFIDSFNKTNNDFNYAIANFSRLANLISNLDDPSNDASDFSEVKDLLVTIVWEGRVTRHNLPLEIACDQMFTNTGGDRNDTECPDIIILITDGRNNTGGDAVGMANQLKANGTTILCVTVWNFQVIELKNAIASPDRPVTSVDSFEELSAVVSNLTDATCPEPGMALLFNG